MLEICAANPESVRIAAENGADRVELCSALSLDGLTPSVGLIDYALTFKGLRVHVLIRPREGDFVYSPEEVDVMVRDIEAARRLGAHGVVIGALNADGTLCMDVCRRLMKAAGGMDVTFHRAFDIVPDPFAALEQVIGLGCTRILTSGQAKSAEEGLTMLARLHDAARGRIRILAGAGVGPHNVARIIAEGKADEVHGSLSCTVGDRRVTSPDLVKDVKAIVNTII